MTKLLAEQPPTAFDQLDSLLGDDDFATIRGRHRIELSRFNYHGSSEGFVVVEVWGRNNVFDPHDTYHVSPFGIASKKAKRPSIVRISESDLASHGMVREEEILRARRAEDTLMEFVRLKQAEEAELVETGEDNGQ